MRAVGRVVMVASVLLASVAVQAAAADKVSGKFTVAGKSVKLAEVYATLETDPKVPSRRYLALILADVPVLPTDRTPGRMLVLAKAGRLHALRVMWTYGADEMTVTPYHSGVAETGQAFRDLMVLDIRKFNDINVDADLTSKKLNVDWQFDASVNAAIAAGGVAVFEPAASADPAASSTAKPATSAEAVAKRQLAGLKYEYTQDAFFQAIGDRNVDAVKLFLDAGMSPNQENDQHRRALNHAVLFCGADAAKASAILVLLVQAKGDLKSQDPDNKTTPLVGAVHSCTVDAINALVKAGSDLTAKSAGGMTALQLADIFQRQDIAAALRQAGAK